LKLTGTLAFNPISALTHATLEELCTFPPTKELVHSMMKEAESIAKALGATIRLPLEVLLSIWNRYTHKRHRFYVNRNE
jgi:2-dehydropantoate 2-reductase